MWIVERMHTANAVYFSIFYCGCKQLKSIHFIFGCKDSANRTKCQIYLNISEVPPIFKLLGRLKIVQGERKSKFICIFPSRRLSSNCEVRLKIVQPMNEANVFSFHITFWCSF